MKKHTRQTLALAGIAQAAFLVHQLSRHGMVSQDNLETSINSLFVISPGSTEEVYGSVSRVTLGLQVLQEIFQGAGGYLKNPDVMRYIFSLLYLESKLHKNKRLLDAIGAGLEEVQQTCPAENRAGNPDVIARLGEIYQDTLSTMRFRVQVKGELEFLRNESNAAKIRAVLLAGIRSAVLWRQLGGRRWHLLFHRKRISEDIKALLEKNSGA